MSKQLREKPAQDQSQKKVIVLESQLNSLLLTRDSGLGGDDTHKKVKDIKKALIEEKKSLKRKQEAAQRQQKLVYMG